MLTKPHVLYVPNRPNAKKYTKRPASEFAGSLSFFISIILYAWGLPVLTIQLFNTNILLSIIILVCWLVPAFLYADYVHTRYDF